MRKNVKWGLFTFSIVFGSTLLAYAVFSFVLQKAQPVYALEEPPIPESPLALQNALRKVSAEVLPAIVQLDTASIRKVSTSPVPEFPWEFFFQTPDEKKREKPKEKEFRSSGLGSGVLIKKEGSKYFVLTNAHVVEAADEVTVKLNDERKFDAKIVGVDKRRDVALVAFETKEPNIKVAALGNSDQAVVGDFVVAIGSPFGFQSSVSFGIVSALGRRGGPDALVDYIQTDAAINRGNSGGALVNLKGEVIAINTWISTYTGQNAGLGFSIPINNIQNSIKAIMKDGEVRYGWLGVSLARFPIDDEIRDQMGLPQNESGVLIGEVYEKSPAGKGGIRPGDFIFAVNDRKIADNTDMIRVVGEIPPGQRVTFQLKREGKIRKISVKIADRAPAEEQSKNVATFPSFVVYPLTKEIRQQADINAETRGVLVLSVAQGPVSVAGLRRDDIITHIDGSPIRDLGTFFKLINAKKGERVQLTLLREDLTVGIVVPEL